MMKRKYVHLSLVVIILLLNVTSCYHRGYLPLPEPSWMVLHYKTGEERIFLPDDEEFAMLLECLSNDIWAVGSSPIHCACYQEGEEYRWQNEDYLNLLYNQETTLIPSYKDIQSELTVTGIIFTPNANWEEYHSAELYYLESPDKTFKSYFDTSSYGGHGQTPYYPPLAELFDQLK